jgi:hypothetical protein
MDGEALTCLNHILEAAGSNHAQETANPCCSINLLSPFIRHECRNTALHRLWLLLLASLQISNLPSSNHIIFSFITPFIEEELKSSQMNKYQTESATLITMCKMFTITCNLATALCNTSTVTCNVGALICNSAVICNRSTMAGSSATLVSKRVKCVCNNNSDM